jgi:hypothetical protein
VSDPYASDAAVVFSAVLLTAAPPAPLVPEGAPVEAWLQAVVAASIAASVMPVITILYFFFSSAAFIFLSFRLMYFLRKLSLMPGKPGGLWRLRIFRSPPLSMILFPPVIHYFLSMKPY